MSNREQIISTHYFFESLVFNAINNKLENEGALVLKKNIKINNSFVVDAIIPGGIEELNGPVFVEIKLYRNSAGYWGALRSFIYKINTEIPAVSNILFVLGSELSEEVKNNLIIKCKEKTHHSVIIWSLEDLYKLDSRFEVFKNEDHSNIAKFVVDETVNQSLNRSNTNWKNIRNERLKELQKVYKSEQLVLFLGAGVSQDAGISDWNTLIADLLTLMIRKNLEKSNLNITEQEKDFLSDRIKKINNSSPLLQAAFIKAVLGEEFEQSVAKLLYDNVKCCDSRLLDSISKLCLPKRNSIGIKSVVTYNFDDLLENSFNKYHIDSQPIYNEITYLSTDKLGIYHVHGFLPRNPDEYDQLSESLLVFSEDGYHSLYNEPYSWSNLTQLNFLRENTVLMIGLSLTDPNLRRLLSISNSKNKSKRHYAIMKREKIENNSKDAEKNQKTIQLFESINIDLQEQFFEQLGIDLIWVDNYSDIPDILDIIR